MTEPSAAATIPDVALFSYGTLRVPAVQLDTFGRLLTGEPDVLPGFTIDYLEIEDARVVGLSGRDVHPIIRRTGNRLDKVVGVLLWITEDELEAADEYEVQQYNRVSVTLGSGRDAWVYVAR
ncbi:gamma-glutamylcyclotransferase family protein [Microbacterium sp. BR1]|uniref:gamma-glutamylcyclotransferase family protein n=1 Tax=Microbacterium sp. BR1 TaxID=1070896 RepID=UPI0018E23886|nr:gamma-glutamylcyclotransferase family protein [Microbacterium sp. BR1]